MQRRARSSLSGSADGSVLRRLHTADILKSLTSHRLLSSCGCASIGGMSYIAYNTSLFPFHIADILKSLTSTARCLPAAGRAQAFTLSHICVSPFDISSYMQNFSKLFKGCAGGCTENRRAMTVAWFKELYCMHVHLTERVHACDLQCACMHLQT